MYHHLNSARVKSAKFTLIASKPATTSVRVQIVTCATQTELETTVIPTMDQALDIMEPTNQAELDMTDNNTTITITTMEAVSTADQQNPSRQILDPD